MCFWKFLRSVTGTSKWIMIGIPTPTVEPLSGEMLGKVCWSSVRFAVLNRDE